MSGGKGGSSTSTVEIPEYIEAAAQRNLNKAERISQLGYVPEYGPTVAAFTPMQQAGFQNTANLAGAFGMAAPTTQQDIMGGMPAPTTYAGGVRGYSSAPIYDEMVAELASRRPGQKSYIDSFFIDPFTGEYAYQPTDYTQYTTMAEAARQAASGGGGGGGGGGSSSSNIISTVPADQATGNFYQDNQLYNPDIDYTDPYVGSNNQIVGTLDPSYDPDYSGPTYSASDFPIGSSTTGTDYTVYDTGDSKTTATNSSGSTVSVGYGVGQVDPALAAAAGYDTGDSNTTGSDTSNIGNYGGDRDGDGVPNALDFDDGVGWADKNKSSGGGSSSSSSSGGSSKILCCAYYNLGYLPREIWRLDQRYGVWLHRHDPELMRGYHAWAAPLADFVQKDTAVAKVVRAIMWPIVKAWAEEMAHKQRPEKHKANIAGKVITVVGEAFSRICGKLKSRKIEGVA